MKSSNTKTATYVHMTIITLFCSVFTVFHIFQFGPEHAEDYLEVKDDIDDDNWENLVEQFEKIEDDSSNASPTVLNDELKYAKKGSKGDKGEIYPELKKEKNNPKPITEKKRPLGVTVQQR